MRAWELCLSLFCVRAQRLLGCRSCRFGDAWKRRQHWFRAVPEQRSRGVREAREWSGSCAEWNRLQCWVRWAWEYGSCMNAPMRTQWSVTEDALIGCLCTWFSAFPCTWILFCHCTWCRPDWYTWFCHGNFWCSWSCLWLLSLSRYLLLFLCSHTLARKLAIRKNFSCSNLRTRKRREGRQGSQGCKGKDSVYANCHF